MLVLHYSWISTIILLIICIYFYFYKYFYKFVFESFENSSTYILLGDSILNNSNYVKENENIESIFINQNENVINLAKDNANLYTMEFQLNELNDLSINPTDIIVLSVGGNDLLANRNINDLKIQYTSLLDQIKNTYPYNEIILLDIYYPDEKNYKNYYGKITEWNNFLLSLKDKKVKVALISEIVSKEDLVYNIEPSSNGGKKIVSLIIST